MALAAYAFLIGGAPRFAVALLVLAWLVVTISIYRHRFFEGKSRAVEALGNAGISAVIAVMFILLWFLLRPSAASSVQLQMLSPTPTETNRSGLALLPTPTSSPLATPIISPATPSPTTEAFHDSKKPKLIDSKSAPIIQPKTQDPVKNTILKTLKSLQKKHSKVTYQMLKDAVEAIKFEYIREATIVSELQFMRRDGILTWTSKDMTTLRPDDVIELNPRPPQISHRNALPSGA